MEKHELKNRVDEIERCLAIALEFAFKEKKYRKGHSYEWLARAYRMTDSLKIILSAEEREEQQREIEKHIKDKMHKFLTTREKVSINLHDLEILKAMNKRKNK